MPILETIVVEVEATLNDRPLTYVSADVTDVEPLTLAHLLYGRRMMSSPHSNIQDSEDPEYVVSDAQMRKQLTNHARLLQYFQIRWKREYLTSLREFHKAFGMNMQNVKVGDVVLIHIDGPRLHWKLGIIDSLLQGNNGLVHAVNVWTNNRVTSRPINRLYPLEVSLPSNSQTECSNATEITTNSTEDGIRDRPQQAATKRARARPLEWSTRLNCPRRMSRTRCY